MVKDKILGCLILFVIGAGLVAGAYFAGNAFGRKYTAELTGADISVPKSEPYNTNTDDTETPVLPKAGKNIVLYVPDTNQGEAAVKAVNQAAPDKLTTDKLTQSMVSLTQKLVKNGILPEGTKLVNKVKVKNGIAFVDFSDDIMSFSGSTLEEAQLLNSLASTAYANEESVKKITVLVCGKKIETLGGHMDLSEPFVPNVR